MKLTTHLCALLCACLSLIFCAQAFTPRFTSRGIRPHTSSSYVIRSESHLLAVKPDLFSDDLFEDDEADQGKKDTKKSSDDDSKSTKKKYLDQKWKLNEEDAKEFKGFPKKDAMPVEKAAEIAPGDRVPCFALMYKFRKEYKDQGLEAVLADHKGHCRKSSFKRLMNSEVINSSKAKGCVLLWAGFTETDKEETRAEIMSFLEEDPFIVKDIVENWDIIDLTPGGEAAKLPPDAAEQAKAERARLAAQNNKQ